MHSRRALLAVLATAAAAAVVGVPPCLAFFPSPSLPQCTPANTGPSRSQAASSRSLVRAKMSSPTAAVAGGDSSSSGGGGMGNKRAIVVVGLNGALQRTIVFAPPTGLRVGHVNRASSVGAGIGGKGQNVCVALRKLAEGGAGSGGEGSSSSSSSNGDDGEVDVTLAHFAGGKSGETVCENLSALGVNLVTSETKAEMRLCTSLVDERFGETTEIIEPWSAEITEGEQQTLLAGCKEAFDGLPRIDGVAVMGSSPAGVGKGTLADVMGAIRSSPGFMGADTRVLVDSVVGFQALVETGCIGLLKVNAEEVVSLAVSGRDGTEAGDGEGVSVWMEDKLGRAAAELFGRHGDRLPWIAVTNGGLPSYLFSREFLAGDGSLSSFWRLTPAPVDAVNPIGAGDAVAAATLYEWTRGVPLPEAFRRAMAVGGAACTSRDPVCNSSFSPDEAKRLLSDVRLEHIQCKQGV